MPVLIAPTLLGTSPAGSGVSVETITVNLPANILIIVDVVQHHSTSASLGTVGVTSPTIGTWHQEATTTEGGGSAKTRFTRFSGMVTSDANAEVITATASATQTNLQFRVTAHPGNLPGGTSASIRQTVTANSGGANVTTLSPAPTLAALGTSDNGVFVGIVGVASVTPKSGYTELVDGGIGGANHEAQYLLSNDTTPNGTQSSGFMMGIASEIVAVPNPSAATASGVASSAPFTSPPGTTMAAGQYLRAGANVVQFLVFEGSDSRTDGTYALVMPLNPKVTSTLIYSSIDTTRDRYFYVYQLIVSGTIDVSENVGVTLALSAGSGTTPEWSAFLVTAQNVDTTQGTHGVIQSAGTQFSAASGPQGLGILPSAFASPTNAALLFAGCKGIAGNNPALASLDPGWQLLGGGGDVGANVSHIQAYFRPNAPTAIGATSNSTTAAMCFVELATLITPTAPVVTLVTPSNGSTIAIGSSITVNATDIDGDLATVVIYANGVPVYTSGAYQTGFTSSTRNTLTAPNGFQFVFAPTAWTPGALGITVEATDARGNVTIGLFNFTVAGNDFSLSRTPSSLSVLQGNANTVSVSASIVSGSAETVTLSISGLPTGVTAGFSPSTITPGGGSSTLTLTVGGSVPPATYTLTITGTAASASHTTTVALTVTTPAVHAPVITLIGPPASGPIGLFDAVTIQITDLDNDLDVSTILANANADTAYTASAFTAGYSGSVQTTITNGVQLVFRRGIGWSGGSLALFLEASDSGSRTTTAFFTWAPVTEPGIPTAGGFVAVTALGDVKVQWGDGETDNTIISGDIGADQGMRTAILLSLFTDRRAEEDDPLPSDDGDRRGWWGDEFAAVGGDLFGSRLWLLDRSAKTEGVTQRAEEYVREALQWMLDDHVADRIDVTVTDPGDELLIDVSLQRPNAKPITFRFANVWANP